MIPQRRQRLKVPMHGRCHERCQRSIATEVNSNRQEHDIITENYGSEHNIEYIATQDKKTKNQIISSIETKQETKKLIK